MEDVFTATSPATSSAGPRGLFAPPLDYDEAIDEEVDRYTSAHNTRASVLRETAARAKKVLEGLQKEVALRKSIISEEDLKERQQFVEAAGYKKHDPTRPLPLATGTTEGLDPALHDSTRPPPTHLDHLQSGSFLPNTTPAKSQCSYSDVNDLQEKAHAFCVQNFAGKVVVVQEVEELIGAMGGVPMLRRLKEAERLSEKWSLEATVESRTTIEKKYRLEAKILSKLNSKAEKVEKGQEGKEAHEEVKADPSVGVKNVEDAKNTHGKARSNKVKEELRALDLKGAQWLLDWARFGYPEGETFTFHVISAPNHPLPPRYFIRHQRKPDALFAKHPHSYGWHDAHLCVEFSLSSGGIPDSEKVGSTKAEQIITNLNNFNTEHPLRSYSVGISIFDNVFTIYLLDWMNIRIFRLEDCFADKNFFRVASILSTLLSASIYELGLSPLLSYQGSLPVAYDPRALDSTIKVDQNLELIIPLSPIPLSPANATPFHRGTIVYAELLNQSAPSSQQGGVNEVGFRVFKMAHHELYSTEPKLFEIMATPPSISASRPHLLPQLISSLTLDPFQSQMKVESLPKRKQTSQLGRRATIDIARHLEILILKTPVRGMLLHTVEGLPGSRVGNVFADVLEAIVVLWSEKSIVHRDISLNNILVLPDQFRGCLIDFDCARCQTATVVAGRKIRIGTRDSMSIALLRNLPNFVHQPIHDIESLVYTTLKYLTTMMHCLMPKLCLREKDGETFIQWTEFFESFHWNDSEVKDEDLSNSRMYLWANKNLTALWNWSKHLASGYKVNCDCIAKFVKGMVKLRLAGVINKIHGMEHMETSDELGLDSLTVSDKEELKVGFPEQETKKEMAQAMYLDVTKLLKEMFLDLATGNTDFLELLCRTYEADQKGRRAVMEKEASGFFQDLPGNN